MQFQFKNKTTQVVCHKRLLKKILVIFIVKIVNCLWTRSI